MMAPLIGRVRTKTAVGWALGLAVAGIALSPAVAAPDDTPFPDPGSKKGLQVQMIDDALALGVRHASLNVSLGRLMRPDATATSPGVVRSVPGPGAREFAFDESYLASLDASVKPLSDGGAVVYMILLAYRTGEAGRDAVVLHPKARADHAYSVGAFNSVTDDGRAWLRATAGFLAARYSGPRPAGGGRVWGYIVGNEANSHFMWYNRGLAPFPEVISDYETAFRLVHQGVREASARARVYLSLDHHWTAAIGGVSPEECGPGREFLDSFARLVRERGDLDWHVAHHPYPEDLGNPRVWADRSVTVDDGTPKVTFKNLEVLTRHLEQPELRWHGEPRRVILSEQGFNTPDTPDGESLQAAGFAYAWEKVARLPTIDAFIYHRHTDHRDEGGLRLGLWTRQPESVATPSRRKRIYDLFKAAGTPAWEEKARPFLEVTGLKSWDGVMP